MFIPTIIERTPHGERGLDLFTKLLDERIVICEGDIEDQMASVIIAQLLYLDSQDNDKPISLYVNSPGGSVSAGLAIIDTINIIKAPVSTIGMGMCASMGAMILMSGTKGMRKILPHAEVMIHQPLGSVKGQETEIRIAYEHIQRLKDMLYNIIHNQTGQPINKIEKDCDRDYYMSDEDEQDMDNELEIPSRILKRTLNEYLNNKFKDFDVTFEN